MCTLQLGNSRETKPEENAWDVGRVEVERKEQGFPTPGEVFVHGEDPQKGTDEKSLLLEEKRHHVHGHKKGKHAKRNGAHKKERSVSSVKAESSATLDADADTSRDDTSRDVESISEAKKEISEEPPREPEDADIFQGPILHSSQLDREDAPSFEGKRIVVVGGGASAVEFALAQGASSCVMLARDDKVRFMF